MTVEITNASAGTGKTYTLTENLKSYLSQNSIDNLMATTFTKKAAEELKSRIRTKLLAMGKKEEATAVLSGKIGTINSIFGKIVERNAFQLGINPNVIVLDENKQKEAFNLIAQDVVSEKIKNNTNVFDMLYRLSIDAVKLIEEINSISIKCRQNNITDNTAIDTCCQNSINEYNKILPKNSLAKNTFLANVQKEYTLIEKPKAAVKVLDNPSLIDKWSKWQDLYTETARPSKKGTYDALCAEIRNFPQLDEFKDDIRNYIKFVYECVKASQSKYADYKKKNGFIDFQDQECKMLELLDKGVKISGLEDLDALYVDEFQDTNPIQLALFSKIKSINPNIKFSYFGDPKQAIYRFRGADANLTDAVNCNTNPNNLKTLNETYRSNSNLVEVFNAIFEPVFSKYMDLTKITLNENHIYNQKSSGFAVDVIKNDNNSIIGSVCNILSSQKNMTYFDGSKIINNAPLLGNDICVLFNSNDTIDAFVKEAKKRFKISTKVSDIFSIDVCLLVKLLMQAFVVGNTPYISAFVDALFNKINLKQYKYSLNSDIDSLINSERVNPKYKFSILNVFDEIISSGIVQEYLKNSNTINDDYQALDALRGVIIKYEEYCQQENLALSMNDFFIWADKNKDVEDLFSCPPSLDKDAVRVMTTHKAKGLEWKVVICDANEYKEKDLHSYTSQSLTVGNKGIDPNNPLANREVHYFPSAVGGKETMPDLYDEANTEIEKFKGEEAQEFERRQYVAYTRAKEKLILYRNEKKDEVPVFYGKEYLENQKLNYRENFLVDNGQSFLNFDAGMIKQTEYTNQSSDEFKLNPRNKSHYKYFKKDAFKGETTEIEFDDKYSYTKLIDDNSSTVGSLLHAFFALNINNEDLLKKKAEVLSKLDNRISSEQAINLRNRLYKFIDTLNPSEILTEWPIEYKMDNQLVKGTIDMIIETNNGFYILDHKIVKDDKSVIDDYSPQLAIYKKIVEEKTGDKCLGCYLHLPLQNKLVLLK